MAQRARVSAWRYRRFFPFDSRIYAYSVAGTSSFVNLPLIFFFSAALFESLSLSLLYCVQNRTIQRVPLNTSSAKSESRTLTREPGGGHFIAQCTMSSTNTHYSSTETSRRFSTPAPVWHSTLSRDRQHISATKSPSSQRADLLSTRSLRGLALNIE